MERRQTERSESILFDLLRNSHRSLSERTGSSHDGFNRIDILNCGSRRNRIGTGGSGFGKLNQVLFPGSLDNIRVSFSILYNRQEVVEFMRTDMERNSAFTRKLD